MGWVTSLVILAWPVATSTGPKLAIPASLISLPLAKSSPVPVNYRANDYIASVETKPDRGQKIRSC